MPMDVSQKSSIDDCIQKLASEHKVTVDILISNAGVSLRGTIMDTDIEVHRKMMEINYFGPVNLVKGKWVVVSNHECSRICCVVPYMKNIYLFI